MVAHLFPPGIPTGKRLFDLVLTIPGLVVLSPFLGLIALVLRLSQGSPVFFRQKRPGYKSQIFTLDKFRTMRDARDPGVNITTVDGENVRHCIVDAYHAAYDGFQLINCGTPPPTVWYVDAASGGEFNDGTSGVVDLTDALWGPMFEPLRDVGLFRRLAVSDSLHTLFWENGADLAPEYLYEKLTRRRAPSELPASQT